MFLLSCVLVLALTTTFAAPASDQILSLPGWNSPLPSPPYSGYLDLPGGNKHSRFNRGSLTLNNCYWTRTNFSFFFSVTFYRRLLLFSLSLYHHWIIPKSLRPSLDQFITGLFRQSQHHHLPTLSLSG